MSKIHRFLLALCGAFALTLAFITPANAAPPNSWIDSGETTVTVFLTNSSGTQFAKVVTKVQLFTPSGNTALTSITATRGTCSIRNLNGSYISGVLVSECAIGINGSTINNNTTDALDGGGCCANSASFIRNIQYSPSSFSLRARGTYCWRYVFSGVLDCQNFLSDPSNATWVLDS